MSRTNTDTHQGDAAALRDALRRAVAALEKALDDGCAIQQHDRINFDGEAWTMGGICALAYEALGNEQEQT